MIDPADILTIVLLVLLEGLLSADNAMVLAVLVLGLPKKDQKKALRYGIFGAFIFRGIAVVFAMQLIGLSIVKLLGGLYLIYLPYRHFWGHGHEEGSDRRAPPKATPWLFMSALWATVVKVELTDIVFAIDSIMVAVAMSSKVWVVLTGGILGIITMRLVIGQLLVIVQRYPPLVDGAFVIIAWVGAKLLLEWLHAMHFVAFEVPKWFSLGLIVAIFLAALAYARAEEKKKNSKAALDSKAAQLTKDEAEGPGTAKK
ncbi:MAG: hypothetical protein ACE148_12250 [Vicinamibacterales bacterium]